MPFSHYPKTVNNIVMAWVQPPPPDVPRGKGLPDFLGRPFSEINLWKVPLLPGQSVVGYHDAQPFTRFYGSIGCDQKLQLKASFSNDEVAPDGHWVTDANLPSLHYDAQPLIHAYDPDQQALTGRFWFTIFGRWLKIELLNVSDRAPAAMRLYVRGSVF